MNKTLYISDLDGTLLNSSAELSGYAATTLGAMLKKGMHFSVATARTASSALKILPDIQWNVPFILLNGVLIYDYLQKLYIRTFPFTAEAVTAITNLLKQFDVTGLMYQFTADGEQLNYYESLKDRPLREFVEERQRRYKKTFIHTNFVNSRNYAGHIPRHLQR